MNSTQRAQDIKAKLDDLHVAVDDLPSTVKANLVRTRTDALHATLETGLTEQGNTLGISSADQYALAGGGTPKDRAGA